MERDRIFCAENSCVFVPRDFPAVGLKILKKNHTIQRPEPLGTEVQEFLRQKRFFGTEEIGPQVEPTYIIGIICARLGVEKRETLALSQILQSSAASPLLHVSAVLLPSTVEMTFPHLAIWHAWSSKTFQSPSRYFKKWS